MNKQQYAAFFLLFALWAAFIVGLFLKPQESSASLAPLWYSEYFTNSNFEGQPAHTRYEEAVDVNWSEDAPLLGFPRDGFSVRWSARVALEGGLYRFRLGGDEGIRLFIDGELTLENPAEGLFQVQTQELYLAAGDYTLRVEYRDESGLAGALFDWVRVRP